MAHIIDNVPTDTNEMPGDVLLPDMQDSIIPQVSLGAQHTPATSEYLSSLLAATSALNKDLGSPKSPEEWEAIVTSPESEKIARDSFASHEARTTSLERDATVRQMVIEGANTDAIEVFLGGRSFNVPSQEELDAKARSVLERGAAKWLVDQGLASPERAAIMLNEQGTTPMTDLTDTDRREEYMATALRIQTMRQRISDQLKDRPVSEDILDLLAFAFVPGHTTISESKVFGRAAPSLSDFFNLKEGGGSTGLGKGILQFSTKFWNAPVSERMAILDEFEKDLENNAIVGQNLIRAAEQLTKLETMKPEDVDFVDLQEILDVVYIGAIARSIKNTSVAARTAGSSEVSTGRSLVLRDQDEGYRAGAGRGPDGEFPRYPYGYTFDLDPSQWRHVDEGKYKQLGSIARKEDELVEGTLPTIYHPKPLSAEVPAGPTAKAMERVDMDALYKSLLPTLVKEAEKAGHKVDVDNISPSNLLALLRDVIPPEILSATEQVAAEQAAIRVMLRDYGLDLKSTALVDPSKALGAGVRNRIPLYDVAVDDISGIRTVHMYLGTGEDRLKGFVSKEAAIAGAERMGIHPEFYSISDQSGKFFVKVTRNVESTSFIRAIDDKELPFVLPILGNYLQGGKTTSTADAAAGASLSVKVSSRMLAGIEPFLSKIGLLGPASRATYDNLMLDIQENEAWGDVKSVNKWYMKNYQRLPSNKEVEAYLATRHLYQFDWVSRNANLQKELVSQGYQEVLVKGVHRRAVIGKEVATTSVDPRSTRIYNAITGKFAVDVGSRSDLDKVLKKNPDSVLVKLLSESRAYGQYVISTRTNVNKKALRANVLKWVDGPHRIYEGDHWVRQQRVRKIKGQETVVNAKTHFAIKGQKESAKVAQQYNDALDAYLLATRSNSPSDRAKASEIISRNTYFAGYDEFAEAVKTGRIETTPFESLKEGELPLFRSNELAGTRAVDPDFANFSGSLQQVIEQGRLFYSRRGERLKHPKEGLAPLLHPNDIMSRAISGIVNTNAYTNYKLRQVTRWVKSYGKYMVNPDPYRPSIETFLYGQWNNEPRANKKLNPSVKRRAEAQRGAIKRLLGDTGIIDESITEFQREIIDWIDNKLNVKWADRAANITSTKPLIFLRGFAFKAYLGSMDVSQLIVQLSMLPGMMGVAPKEAMLSFTAYPFMRAALLNPTMDVVLATHQNRFTAGKGISEKQFVELMQDIRRSGVDIVDANIGELDNMTNRTSIKNMGAKLIQKTTDSALFFFNEAEKANRVLGFSIAWLEWYKKTGHRPATVHDFGEVAQRGDAFSGNMSREAKSWWQNGVLGNAAQFAGFTARVFENLLMQTPGGFKTKDKLKLYTGLALAYGITLGAGSGFEQYLKESYKKHTGSEAPAIVIETLTRGITGIIFSETDLSRIQPWGQDTLLAKLYDDNNNFLDIISGPSGALVGRAYDAIVGTRKLLALTTGEVTFDMIPLSVADIGNDILRMMSSYSRAEKAIHAWQHKTLVDKQGRITQADLDTFDGFMLMLGFPPIESKEAFTASTRIKDARDKVKKDATLAVGFLREAMKAEPGSVAEKYAIVKYQYIAKINKEADTDGANFVLFLKAVDSEAKRNKVYTEQLFLRLDKTLNVKQNSLIRK